MKQLPPPPPILPAQAEPDLGRLSRVIYRQRFVLASVVVLALLAGVVVTILQIPRYESAATILLEQEESGPNLLSSFAPPGLAVAAGIGRSGSIQTDIGVLQSRSLAEAVVDSLRLNVVLQGSPMPRDSLIEVISAPKSILRGGTYRLRHRGAGRFTVDAEAGSVTPYPDQVTQGSIFQLAGAQLRFRPRSEGAWPEEFSIVVRPFRTAVALLQEDLQVIRPDPTAQLVQIAFEDADPVIAAEVPNALARSFVAHKTRENRQQSLTTVGFLEEQVANYEDALREAEAGLEEFREQAQVYSPEEQARSGVQQIASLQAERDALAAEHASLLVLLRRLDAVDGGADGPSPYRQLASFPTFLANGAVQDILRSLSELETERSSLLVRRTPDNDEVRALDNRIGDLERQLHRLATHYADNLETNLASIGSNLAGYRGELATIPAREIALLRLTREQKLLEQVYTLLQTQLKEEQIEATRVAGNVRVIDAALVPLDPTSPKPLLNLAIAGLLGLLAALAIMILRELATPRIHSGDDLLLAGVGAPVLGIIPAADGASRLHRVLPAPLYRRLYPPPPDRQLVTQTDPFGMGAEAYRSLRSGVLRGAHGSPPQVIVVTSALAGEGKTVSASNLAISLAQQRRSTLLLDADLRGGKLHEVFQIERSPGLSDVLLGEAPLEEALRQISVAGIEAPFVLMPVGSDPLAVTDLIDSEHVSALLDSLRGRFQHIIIDTPPLNLLSDGAVLAGRADATLLVARAGVTDRRALQDAASVLMQLHVPLSGVVLTDARGMGWYRNYIPAGMQNGA